MYKHPIVLNKEAPDGLQYTSIWRFIKYKHVMVYYMQVYIFDCNIQAPDGQQYTSM